MDDFEHTYSAPDDTYVCANCVTDPHLQAVLRGGDEGDECSYCGALGASDISILLDEIEDAIQFEHTDPAEELTYESAEGGYIFPPSDGSDVVESMGTWTECDELLTDVADAFAASSWCKRDFFGLDQFEALKFGWQGFCACVKGRNRFMFQDERDEDEHDPRHISPGAMLAALGKLFLGYDFVRTFPTGTEFARARVVPLDQRPCTAGELGTPPSELAVLPNRMSAAGIAMFYGAADDDTAVLETFDPERAEGHHIALAHFRTERPLTLLDLASLPDIPSQFDRHNRASRLPIAFLHAFEIDLTRPIERDGRVHIEYVPTQIVTEFVRHRLRTATGKPFDGIAYRSSRDRCRTAFVLFAENEHCGPQPERTQAQALLTLTRVRYAVPGAFDSLWAS